MKKAIKNSILDILHLLTLIPFIFIFMIKPSFFYDEEEGD